jgi:hypothetical protein
MGYTEHQSILREIRREASVNQALQSKRSARASRRREDGTHAPVYKQLTKYLDMSVVVPTASKNHKKKASGGIRLSSMS